jgi:hypothetical protein
MKKALILTAILAGSVAGAMAATVASLNLNDTAADANGLPISPIYNLETGTLATGDVFVEILGNGASLGQTTASAVDMGGAGKNFYWFNAGYGDFASTVKPGDTVNLEIRAWTGAATFDTAPVRGTASLTQTTGSRNDGMTGGVLTGIPDTTASADLQAFGALTMNPVVPEPATLALLAIGGAALFFRRRQ